MNGQTALTDRVEPTSPASETLWRAAFEQHAAALRAYLRRRLRRPEEADDLVQESFVRAIQARGSELDPAEMRPYLFTTARRLLIDKARRADVVDLALFASDEPPDLAALPADPADSPESGARRRRFGERLAEAIGLLPEGPRRAFELAVVGQLPYATVAQRQGWSAEQVRVNVHRARRRLLELLGDELGGLRT